ncbi:MAG: hypothetical protein RL588_818 [Pseudomonadota bacterium]
MKRDDTRLYGAVAAAVVLAGAGGFALSTMINRPDAPAEEAHGEEGEHAEGGGSEVKLTPQQASAAGIAVVTVSQGGAGDLRLTGRVEAAPSGRAAVASPVSGAIVRVLVAPGTNVGAGAGLAVIRSAEGAAVRAESIAAGAEAEAARAALAREERLFKAGVTARQDFEAARAAAARASAEAVAARAKVAASGGPGASGETVVRSPIPGVVTALQVAPGGFVAQGGAVAEVANPGQVEVVFNAPAEAAAKLRVGAPLRVIGPDGSEANAVIVGIAPLAQGATGAAIVRARPSGGRLTPGAAVSAAIATETGGYPTVPAEAVQTVAGRSVVFIAEGDGFRAQPVTPGRSGAGYTQIVEGLKGGERIAGRGAFVLKAELSKGEAEHED